LAEVDVVKVLLSAVFFAAVVMATVYGWAPLVRYIRKQEAQYDQVLRGSLLLDVSPRVVTVMALGGVVLVAAVVYSMVGNAVIALAGGCLAMLLPSNLLKYLRTRRMARLEDQLVNGIQTLSSGVRAGLNLVQAMNLLANSGIRPISQEFAHMMREYEHGVPLEQCMSNAAARIGSSNYRLLFSALQTHRERGGDLGETLDRIAESIREIHRLEKRIETLTAPGRAAARGMALVLIVIVMMLRVMDPEGMDLLLTEDSGKALMLIIVVLLVLSFIWIRKIVTIDV
jgi:tight adherence protein B